MEIKEGDEVRLVDIHHAMNKHLKGKEGEVGTVIDKDHGYDGKLVVEFEDQYGSKFRISPERVELEAQDNGD